MRVSAERPVPAYEDTADPLTPNRAALEHAYSASVASLVSYERVRATEPTLVADTTVANREGKRDTVAWLLGATERHPLWLTTLRYRPPTLSMVYELAHAIESVRFRNVPPRPDWTSLPDLAAHDESYVRGVTAVLDWMLDPDACAEPVW